MPVILSRELELNFSKFDKVHRIFHNLQGNNEIICNTINLKR